MANGSPQSWLILADLPYGVTGLKIDVLIDMSRLWAEYRRIIRPTGNIVLFGSQPFTTALVNAAPDLFKYACTPDGSRLNRNRQAVAARDHFTIAD